MIGQARAARGRVTATVVLTLLAATLPAVPSASAADSPQPRPADRVVTPTPVAARPLVADPRQAAAAKLTASRPDPAWPRPGRSEVALPAAGAVPAGVLVRLGRPAGARGVDRGASQRLRVDLLDRAALPAALRDAVVLRVAAAASAPAAGGDAPVEVSVDYSRFRHAFGGDWAARLRLAALPECALTTPQRSQCRGSPVAAQRNDLAAGTVSATVTPGSLLALSAGTGGDTGDFAATSLSPSAAWTAGGATGEFSWSYPVAVPPSPAGPAPTVSLAYSSSSVDGRNGVTNNQPSWIGEGFEYSPGAIERRYRPCSDDTGGGANNPTATGDLCWATDNAVLSLNGRASELIRDDATGAWRLRDDDASKVERLTGTVNDDGDNEYWRVTAADGTRYFFGLNRLPGWTSGGATTNATWAVPVFGNHPGEPCHAATFAGSWCQQAWRWNLDYVVDPHGNTMSLWYAEEANRYGLNQSTTTSTAYTRGGHLTRIDYGTDNRDGTEYPTSPAAWVEFATADRCLSNCTTRTEARWPDTPWDLDCTGSACPVASPTFWSTKRLATVTTRVRGGQAVSSVQLTHTFPAPGDGTRAGLWLERIVRTGHAGGTVTLPEVRFEWLQMHNRVELWDGKPTMNWMRMASIWTETGGRISIGYTPRDCADGNLPANAHTNTRRCYPTLSDDGSGGTRTDWWHKYLVTHVHHADHATGQPTVKTSYEYLGGAAWHYADDDGLIDPKHKTWSSFRGYAKVRAREGEPGQDTLTETTYLRGMHGDRSSPSGGTRDVQVAASVGAAVDDNDAWAGMVREEVVYNGSTAEPVSKVVNVPWQSAPTASRTINGSTVHARFARTATVYAANRLDAGRGWRSTQATSTFDGAGMVTQTDDHGDLGLTGDERCVRTTYARNTAANLLEPIARVQTFALGCAQTPTSPDHVISDVRHSYDGQSYGANPTKGDLTRVESLKNWSAGGGTTWLTASTADHDAAGRVVRATDVRGNATTTAYTPALGGPVTKVTTTNHLGWVATTDLDPRLAAPVKSTDVNGKVSEVAYDALGRVAAVWRPNRPRAAWPDHPNVRYAYLVRTTGATAISTSRLNAAGNYVTVHELLDGLLRPVQTQAAAVGASGRVLTNTFYDAAGRAVRVNEPHFDPAAPPGTTHVAPPDWQVKAQTVTEYDRAGRVVVESFRSAAQEQWRTSYSYGGDRTRVTPPAGETATTAITDARGRTVELRQHHGPTPSSDYDAVSYSHNRKGQLVRVVDPAGNQWQYTYDVRGRRVSTSDPDRGATTTAYNDADDVTATTDARGRTLAYAYDSLGRRTAVHDGSLSGTKRAEWAYDTVSGAKGHLASSTRYVGADAWTRRIQGYTATYQPQRIDHVVPASAGSGLAGTHTFQYSYHVDDSPATVRYPAGGGLGAQVVEYVYDAASGLPSRLLGGSSATLVSDTQWTVFGELAFLQLNSTGGQYVQRIFEHDESTRRLSRSVTYRQTAPQYVADVRYAYDAAGNVTRISEAPAGGPADTQCFAQDHLRRLVAAWTPGSGDCAAAPSAAGLGGPAPYWQSWTFDRIGNRLTQTSHAVAGNTVGSYTYPAAGQSRPHAVTSVSSSGPGAPPPATYGYDAAGNTTSRPGAGGAQTLTWDSEGRLASVAQTGQGSTGFIYDADGARLARTDPTGTTVYLPGQELHRTPAGTTTATRYYTFAGQICASRTPAGLTWLAADHQGTQQIAIADTGQQVTRRRQTPYGGPRGTQPAWPHGKGFVGGDADATGLTHLGAREYDPSIGRFISVDPRQDLTDPQHWNGYSYANNSPITLTDPDGLEPRPWHDPKYGRRSGMGPAPARQNGRGSGRSGGATSGFGAAPRTGFGPAGSTDAGTSQANGTQGMGWGPFGCDDLGDGWAVAGCQFRSAQFGPSGPRDCAWLAEGWSVAACEAQRAAEDRRINCPRHGDGWAVKICRDPEGSRGYRRPRREPVPERAPDYRMVPFALEGFYVSVGGCLLVCIAGNGTVEGINGSVSAAGCCGPGITFGYNDAHIWDQETASYTACLYYVLGMCFNQGTRRSDDKDWVGLGVTIGGKGGGQAGPVWSTDSWCPWCAPPSPGRGVAGGGRW